MLTQLASNRVDGSLWGFHPGLSKCSDKLHFNTAFPVHSSFSRLAKVNFMFSANVPWHLCVFVMQTPVSVETHSGAVKYLEKCHK